MITVNEAQTIVLQAAQGSRKTEKLPLKDSLSRVLAEAVLSPASLPPFDQSAMDGYAFRFADLAKNGSTFEVVDEVAAGDTSEVAFPMGSAVRIFTGAGVPEGLDTVIMQELTSTEGNTVTVQAENLKFGANVRKAGEQIREGEVALPAGLELTPGTIGFLGSLGFNKVTVYAQPRVNVVVSGSEFASEMAELKQGKVFESNGVMLQTTLQTMGIHAATAIAIDDEEIMRQKISEALANADVVLVTGGVSVGDYDFTKPVLEALGFTTHFHKVKQKPGKPLLFMQKGDQFAFGLPGNPRSSLICFYEYVWPFLRARAGNAAPQLRKTRLPITQSIRRRAGREEFLTGKLTPEGVMPLGVKGSHILKDFADADCLIVAPAEAAEIPKNTWMDVHLLP